MSTIINNYPVFEDSQVLTSGQLNQMIKYLDQQNRLTRVALIGMGIVCGMDVTCEADEGQMRLAISKGVGVTSEGFLITIGQCETTRYRVYEKPVSVSYPPFENDDLVMYELLTATALTDPEVEVFDLEDDGFLDDKVVILYLECFDKDLKSCLGKSCDELGIDRIFTLRKLLIDRNQLVTLVLPELAGGISDAVFPDKLLLPKLIWQRPLFYKDTDSYYELCLKYIDAITSDQFLPALGRTYEVYEPVLAQIYGSNPFSSPSITSKVDEIVAFLQEFLEMNQPLYGIQYVYDFVKDLALAYEEFRSVSFDLTSVCCPDMDRFPKHLMLGLACADQDDLCTLPEFRNVFASSPAMSKQEHLLEKVQFLHKRLVLLIEGFDLQRLRQPEQWPLKITPSCEKKGWLSQRSIPIYYDSKKESEFENLSNLENTWNFETKRKCYSSDFPQQLSYDNHDFGDNLEHHITTPLGFDLDQFNFLRIEGILGKNVNRVRTEIDQAKKLWNLSFDVKAIHFGELRDDRPMPECLASDLQTDYSIWRHKLLLILNNLVKSSRAVERVVVNRNAIIGSLSSSTISGATKATTGKTINRDEEMAGGARGAASIDPESDLAAQLFNIQELTGGMLKSTGELDISKISQRLFKADINIANASKASNDRLSASFVSEEESKIKGIFDALNNCMINLIQAMPEDIRDFDMQQWLDSYKCILRVYINGMKYLASRADTNLSALLIAIVLIIMCYIFDLIRFISIYPYITIRTLFDALHQRIDQLEASLRFENFVDEHPGIDHKTGVAPGHTFLLVFQAAQEFEREEGRVRDLIGSFRAKEHVLLKGNRNRFMELVNENKIFGRSLADMLEGKADAKVLQEVAKRMENLVVADFTLPFVCCDDCSNLPHTPLPLDPLVTPICGIIRFAGLELQGYRPFKKQILNDLYDPAVYRVRVQENTNFGTATLQDAPYPPDANKRSQAMIYEVDLEKINREKETNTDYFFIDEFEYEVEDITKNEIVGKDLITIFIPVVQEGQGVVRGTVTFVDADGISRTLPGVEVTVEGTDLREMTGKDGTYEMLAVPTGEQVMKASRIQFGSQERTATISGGENTVDFQISRSAITGVLRGTVTRVSDGITAPAIGANVVLKETNFSASTQLEGDFTIRNIPVGSYEMETSLQGFNTDTQTVNVAAGANLVEVTLTGKKGGSGSLTGVVEGLTANGERIPLKDVKIEVFTAGSIAAGMKPRFATTTDDKGSYTINKVGAGKYRIKATFNGFQIDEKESDLADKGQNKVDFVLDQADESRVNTDRILEAMKVKAESKDALKIRNYYSANMGYYNRKMTKAAKRLGDKEVTAVSKAAKVVKAYSDSESINIVKLNNDFNSSRNELMKAWSETSGEEKGVYAESLNHLTMAYLDRLAFAQPDKLSDTSKDILNETGDLFKSNKELQMTGAVENWLENSEGYVSRDYRENVKRLMGVK